MLGFKVQVFRCFGVQVFKGLGVQGSGERKIWMKRFWTKGLDEFFCKLDESAPHLISHPTRNFGHFWAPSLSPF